jgi:hypothetical protein
MAYSPCRLAAKVGPDGQWWQTIGADKVEGLVMGAGLSGPPRRSWF